MQLPTASLTFLLATMAYLAIRGRYQRHARSAETVVNQGTPKDRALVWLVIAGQLVLPALAIFTGLLDRADRSPPGTGPLVIGALLMAGGVWLFWRSHADLGRNWSVGLELRAAHQLITSGVYRRVRHPMYAAFFLMAAGQCLLLPNWVASPAALLAITALYLVRTPHEEAMMLAQFGDDYRQYLAATGALLPRRG